MWTILATILGCGVTEENYFQQLSEVTCSRLKECNKGAFQAEWDNDVGECSDDFMDEYEDAEDFFDDCDFDEDKAKDCLAAMRSDSCGDLYEDGVDDCNDVWDCSDADSG